jgi:transposase
MISCGLDIADKTFTASCLTINPGALLDFKLVFYAQTFEQNVEGWEKLIKLFAAHHITPADAWIIMEATGVYSEKIAHYLYECGFAVYVEPPQKVKKAFQEREKSDPVDSRQIAEYGCRFFDKLHQWRPPDEIVEQIQTLLTARELFSKVQTACKNARKSLQRKQRSFEQIENFHSGIVKECQKNIHAIEEEIKSLIKQNPRLQQIVSDLLTFKSLGFVVIIYLLIATDGFREIEYRKLASYIGVCPFPYESGTSVKRGKHADGAGPANLRKNLYLASMRMMRTHPELKQYYERKLSEKKSGKLALNNLSNKILRIVCGMILSGKPYMKHYRSSQPE